MRWSVTDWLIPAAMLAAFVGAVLWLAKARQDPEPSSSSRGEEAKPEDRNDEMAVARAVGVEPPAVDWELLEEQCYSLEPVVERVAKVREGRR
jgi:hypothetical protein